jgi:hypothetical protein
MPEPIVPSPADSIEVPPNPDNGNVPVDAPDGNGTPPPIDGSNPTPPASDGQPSTPTPELYELPDGRKVDAGTVLNEYKSLLGDYTKKSQIVAQNNPPAADPNINTKPTDPAADPNWQPKTYGEIIEAAKLAMTADMEARENARIAERKAVEDAVSGQITELKATDPNLNENALFQHALKYGFRDLKAAYQNMSDMSKLVKDVKTTTANDIRKRGDPVAGNPSATGVQLNPSHFSNAVEFLRATQGK